MIIIFSSDFHENITMFGNVAERLIKVMGYEVKSCVIKSESISQALTRVKREVAIAPPELLNNDDNKQVDDAYERPISLAHRALPLIEMLEAAEKEKCNVTWKVTG